MLLYKGPMNFKIDLWGNEKTLSISRHRYFLTDSDYLTFWYLQVFVFAIGIRVPGFITRFIERTFNLEDVW